MNRIAIFLAAAAVAATPAVVGLAGNTSFAQTVPVPVPQWADLVSFDDGGAALPEDRATLRPSASPSVSATVDDHARGLEPGDDHGGRSTQAEPGDDHGGRSTEAEPGDDRSRRSASATSSASESADDDGRRRGSDDSPSGAPTGRATPTSDDKGGHSGGGHGGDDGPNHQ